MYPISRKDEFVARAISIALGEDPDQLVSITPVAVNATGKPMFNKRDWQPAWTHHVAVAQSAIDAGHRYDQGVENVIRQERLEVE